MSAKRVRRGSAGRKKPAKKPARKRMTKAEAARQESANKLSRWAFGGFVAATAAVAAAAIDLPTRTWLTFGEAMGDAGFRVQSVEVTGIDNMESKPVYEIALDQKSTAMPLVDVDEIRGKLLKFGWVEDARVSRRWPDTLVIDIVERTPTALWQQENDLSLIADDGTVIDKVKVTEMPDLPLLVGPGANQHSEMLKRMLAEAPSLQPQLESARWVSRRRWDLQFQSGEIIALPEGEEDATTALAKFARLDKSAGLLGRGIIRIDLRVPGKMIVRLPPGQAQELQQEG